MEINTNPLCEGVVPTKHLLEVEWVDWKDVVKPEHLFEEVWFPIGVDKIRNRVFFINVNNPRESKWVEKDEYEKGK